MRVSVSSPIYVVHISAVYNNYLRPAIISATRSFSENYMVLIIMHG